MRELPDNRAEVAVSAADLSQILRSPHRQRFLTMLRVRAWNVQAGLNVQALRWLPFLHRQMER